MNAGPVLASEDEAVWAGSQARWADAMLAAALLAVDPGLGGVTLRARAGPVRDAWLSGYKALLSEDAPWRRLPAGIEDERLLGGLDLGAALAGGRRLMQRGLLADCDGGALVAPMVERLAPELAARLAAVLDTGMVSVERDGLAERTPAVFALVALDEGAEPDERAPEALTDRLALMLDIEGVRPRDATPIAATLADVAEAQASLQASPPLSEDALRALCGAAWALGVESLRAPLHAARAARCLAALEGRDVVSDDDLSAAVRLVLAPRATRLPAPAADADEPAERQPPEPGVDDAGEVTAEALEARLVEAALAALPAELQGLWAAGERGRSGAARGAGRATRGAKRGRVAGVRAARARSASTLDLPATLKAAAPWRRLRAPSKTLVTPLRADDMRTRRYEQRAEATVILVVDASGSSALHRLAEAKGAAELLLADAYVRRTQVALIAFREREASLLLPPTRSLSRARRLLAELVGGGATPLASALEAAARLGATETSKGRTPLLVILTDGRGNVALDGAAFRTRAEADAAAEARKIRATGMPCAVIDISPRPRGEAARLADVMSAKYAALPYVEAGAVRSVARALHAAA